VAEVTADAHKRIHDSATGILSSQQLAVLDGMLKRERDIERARGAVFRLEMQARQDEN
jgi:hypothetical protein